MRARNATLKAEVAEKMTAKDAAERKRVLAAKVADANRKLADMLVTKPGGSTGFMQIETWRQMVPMTSTLFQKYWSSADPLCDVENTLYEEWEDDSHNRLSGMRKIDDGNEQGIVRVIERSGDMTEETRVNGVLDGLRRWITADKVHIQLYR